MRAIILAITASAAALASAHAEPRPHNVVLFVADGLRPGIVDEKTAPTMMSLMKEGVRFANPHAIFPTFTTANAAGMATGHMPGDNGDYSNTVYTGFPFPGAGDSVTAYLESDPVLGDVDDHFGGDFLDEETILKAARDKGFSTATIGKLGPALIMDHTERTGQTTIVVDDSTGKPVGVPLSDETTAALASAGLPLQAPGRGDNGKAGTNVEPGTTAPNVDQQAWFADVTAKVVLPLFKVRDKPSVLVFWSRYPDGTQHYQGDSLGRLVPGINGPTSLAATRNADLSRLTLFDGAVGVC